MEAISIGMLGGVKRETACRSGRKKSRTAFSSCMCSTCEPSIPEYSGNGVKVGDFSFTQSDGQAARKELMEMVGDLIDSQGVCLKGVEICPAR